VVALVAAGRRTDARALARALPDLLVLTGRLLRDPRVPRRWKLALAALAAYLAFPLDLVPDFIPVAGLVFPGDVRRVAGLDPASAEFAERYADQLARLVAHLGR